MGEANAGRMNLDRLVEWASELGLATYGKPDQLRFSVERALAVRYFDGDVVVRDCPDCGFSCPRVESLPECPGCGLRFAGPAEAEPEPKEKKMSNVVAMKQEKREEDAARRRSNVAAAEAKKTNALKKLEKKIEDLVKGAGCIEWDIGKHLGEIYEKDLWQVAGEDFKSFNDYATTRFDFTRQTARAFMRIAETFTRKEASEIPLGHLRLLVTVPDDDERQKLVDMVKEKQPTFRELAEEVKAKRAEAGLNTERAGMEDTTLLNVRLRSGLVAEGEWVDGATKAATRSGTFDLGEVTLRVDDLGDDGFAIALPE